MPVVDQQLIDDTPPDNARDDLVPPDPADFFASAEHTTFFSEVTAALLEEAMYMSVDPFRLELDRDWNSLREKAVGFEFE